MNSFNCENGISCSPMIKDSLDAVCLSVVYFDVKEADGGIFVEKIYAM